MAPPIFRREYGPPCQPCLIEASARENGNDSGQGGRWSSPVSAVGAKADPRPEACIAGCAGRISNAPGFIRRRGPCTPRSVAAPSILRFNRAAGTDGPSARRKITPFCFGSRMTIRQSRRTKPFSVRVTKRGLHVKESSNRAGCYFSDCAIACQRFSARRLWRRWFPRRFWRRRLAWRRLGRRLAWRWLVRR
jgi:hypothetical protein